MQVVGQNLTLVRTTCLELTLHGEDNISYLTLVEGFLVGRGHRFFDRCGAMKFGFCHGEFVEKNL